LSSGADTQTRFWYKSNVEHQQALGKLLDESIPSTFQTSLDFNVNVKFNCH
jgi:hypothetical protein